MQIKQIFIQQIFYQDLNISDLVFPWDHLIREGIVNGRINIFVISVYVYDFDAILGRVQL